MSDLLSGQNLLSGRVKKTPADKVSADRYKWIKLQEVEPDAGVPSLNNGLFASDTNGERKWLQLDTGLTVDGSGNIKVDENTLEIDTSDLSFSSSNNLAGALSDLDDVLLGVESLVATFIAEVNTDNTINGDGNETPLSINFNAFDTDNISEGSSNLYFTQARSRESISVVGALTYDSSTGVIGLDPPVLNQLISYLFIATEGQTTFTGQDSSSETLEYNDEFIEVYVNGVRLNPQDYTATNGETVVLNQPVAEGDEVAITTSLLAVSSVQSVNGQTGEVNLNAGDVGLGNVDDTADLDKPISTATQAALDDIQQGIKYFTVTANYTAESLDGVIADTSGGSFTVTLPASPDEGDVVVLADPTGNWATNNVLVDRNGETIDGVAEDLDLDVNKSKVTMVYDGSTWRVYAQVGVFETGTMAFQDSNDVDITGGTVTGIVEIEPRGTFAKSNPNAVAWSKTGAGTAETGQDLYVEVGGLVRFIASGTTIAMPSLSVGTDYAIWVNPDGTLQASSSFVTPPVAGGRRVGGFHYAPGGNATGTSGGDTTPQINERSFYDLKWKPSVVDPRGLTLVGDGSFWAGMYHMSANHLTGPVHKYNVDPCRGGNPPQNITGSGNYPNASPANIIEALQYHGFRAPDFWEFQLLAFGTTEATSLGGSGPGLTGVLSSGAGNKQRFTSQWGVFDATGVLRVWGNDTILTTSDQTLPNPARGGRFRYSHFARFGGDWNFGAGSGSRVVDSGTATISATTLSSRGVCDHLILD